MLERAVVLILVVLVAACGGGSAGAPPVVSEVTVVPDEANDRLAITNDDQALGASIDYTLRWIPIDNPGSGAAAPIDTATVNARNTSSTLAAVPTGVTLLLVAEIQPPVVDGETVQATSISMDAGFKAMVSYNMRGAPRLGAIDWITKLNQQPKLSSRVVFNDSDISAVSTDGAYVYAAEATDAPEFGFPAVFERIRVKNDKFTLEDNLRLGLTSYAATGVMRTSNEIYVTSGNTGEVTAFEKAQLDPLGAFPLHDARWVAWDSTGNRVVVVQGTPGQISVFEAGAFPGGSMNLLNTYPFPGADVPESKSMAEIAGGKAFIAAGSEGVQIVCLDDGQIVGSVPRPDPAALGLDPSVVVTNAVSVNNNLMFISNGEAGVYVAAAADDFADTDCNAQQQITMLGHLRFDDLQSVNHVAYKNDYLFIAAGLGGVKVVNVQIVN